RRAAALQCGWKMRDWCAWKTAQNVIDGAEVRYFFSAHITLGKVAALDGYIRLHTTLTAKLWDLDEIFWDIFNLSENKERPTGLRGNGAFAVKGPDLLWAPIESKLLPTEENLQSVCAELIAKMETAIADFMAQRWTVWNFEEFVHSEVERLPAWQQKDHNPHRGDTMLCLMLLAILQGDCSKALSLAEEEMALGYMGMYSADRKYIYQYVSDYCKSNLNV
ncbi:MAG: hypothetical protein LBH85_01745, partial [Treponema sp.]|nr:hypothetical protein [Treponema sp.]